MVKNIYNLYPQFTQLTDRKVPKAHSLAGYPSDENLTDSPDPHPVSFERRSGEDRRNNTFRLDARLNNDIDTIKHTFSAFISDKDEFIKQVDKYDKASKNKLINFTDDKEKIILTALSPIVPVRRISSIPNNLEEGNYSKVAGLLGLALINLPEDMRDLGSAAKQIFKNKLPKYDYKNCQAPFSFFRGTILEPIVNKLGKLGVKLHQWDIPLETTKFGNYLEKIFKYNIDELNSEWTGRNVPQVIFDESGKPVIKEIKIFAHKLEGKPLSRLIGRALLRIPVISVLVLGLLELPIIVKKIKDGKELKEKAKLGTIQTIKSFINVTSILTGIGIIGALFAKKGPAYSLLGMGIGSVAGSYVSKVVQNKIDNLTDKK